MINACAHDAPSLIQSSLNDIGNAIRTFSILNDDDDDGEQNVASNDKQTMSDLVSLHDSVLQQCMLSVQAQVRQARQYAVDMKDKQDENNDDKDASKQIESNNDNDDDDEDVKEFDVAGAHKTLLNGLKRAVPPLLSDKIDDLLSSFAISFQS